MFDIGFAELSLLLLIGLLVLGPERLPRAARTIGLYLRKARTAWSNVRQSVEAELDAEEVRKALSQVREQADLTTQGLQQTLNENLIEPTPESTPEPAAKKPSATDHDQQT